MTDEEKRAMGRPPIPASERRSELIAIRATAEEKASFEALGGAEWFRGALRRAVSRLATKTPSKTRR